MFSGVIVRFHGGFRNDGDVVAEPDVGLLQAVIVYEVDLNVLVTQRRCIDKSAVGAATPAAEWVSDNGKALATRSADLADACSGYVRARPLISLAGALTIGYLAGKMLR